MNKDEPHMVLIPNLCLCASDDDFLCGEDIPICPSLIIKYDDSIDVKYLKTSSQFIYLIDGEEATSEPLQIPSLIS